MKPSREIELTPEEVDEELRAGELNPNKVGQHFKAFAKASLEDRFEAMQTEQSTVNTNELPNPLKSPDWGELEQVCKEYIAIIADETKTYALAENLEHRIFWTAMRAIYGKDLFDWINSQF